MNKQWNKAGGYGEAIRRIHDAGINIVGSFIFGLDGDDPSIFRRTFDFIMEHRLDAAQFHILTPFPGTRTFETLKAEGRINEPDWACYHTSEVVIEPKGMTARQLLDGYHWIFRQTYSIPNTLRRIPAQPPGPSLSPGHEHQLSQQKPSKCLTCRIPH